MAKEMVKEMAMRVFFVTITAIVLMVMAVANNTAPEVRAKTKTVKVVKAKRTSAAKLKSILLKSGERIVLKGKSAEVIAEKLDAQCFPQTSATAVDVIEGEKTVKFVKRVLFKKLLKQEKKAEERKEMQKRAGSFEAARICAVTGAWDLKKTGDSEGALKAIETYMVENYRYVMRDFTEIEDNREGYDVIHVFKTRTGICRDFAEIYQAICSYLEIPSRKVRNKDHVWNEVFLNNEWVPKDITWDISAQDRELFWCEQVSREEFLQTHQN